ncbi:MAG: DUF2089 domain-containing protein [Chloroflexi bacterium]|nr:DUF2089 domain-containing protein [Chloroflexota bacterium]
MGYPIVGRCPVCQQALEVTRLHCPHCDTSIEGHFDLGNLSRLTPEQLAFVETFVRCEGRINRLEDELHVSYPTVRNRLEDVIRAMGYEVREEPPLTEKDRLTILEQLATGEIDSSEAIRLLKDKTS